MKSRKRPSRAHHSTAKRWNKNKISTLHGLVIIGITLALILFIFSILLANRLNQSSVLEGKAINAASSLPYTLQSNVTYCTSSDNVNLLMDVYTPSTKTTNMPLVVFTHGGIFDGVGDKSLITKTLNGANNVLNSLTASGYVVASLNFRQPPTYKFPAMVQDAKCAIRYFRANAAQYGIDSTRIGAWGASSGAWLAGLLGTADSSAGWDVGQYLTYSSRVETLVDWYGPTDIDKEYQEAKTNNNTAVIADILRTFPSTDSASLLAASPVSFVTSDDPPTLIEHGLQDTTVYPDISQEFYNYLIAAKVVSKLVWVSNAGHGFALVGPSLISPSITQIVQSVQSTFDKFLKNNPAPLPQ